MTWIDPSHPRFESLRVRARLAAAARAGVVVPEGLIAHGRGEAFDYFLGEQTTPSAARAIRAAAAWLRRARSPVLSVNGNVAALAAPEIAALSRALPTLKVEVNLFHRTPRRAAAIARRLRRAGVRRVLGVRPTARIRGLPSDRAWVDADGIAQADVCLIPLEDGDRAEALRRRGCRVISIDLNPLSRTSRVADLPIVDELSRALRALRKELERERSTPRAAPAPSAEWLLAEAIAAMRRRLATAATRGRSRRRRSAAPASRRRD